MALIPSLAKPRLLGSYHGELRLFPGAAVLDELDASAVQSSTISRFVSFRPSPPSLTRKTNSRQRHFDGIWTAFCGPAGVPAEIVV
jgi:hypothetical protein